MSKQNSYQVELTGEQLAGIKAERRAPIVYIARAGSIGNPVPSPLIGPALMG